MEYDFPPLPPEYTWLMFARWLCVAWNLLGLYWLVRRVRWRKEVQGSDAMWWYGWAFVGLLISVLGISKHAWVSNDWLEPLTTATVSLAIAGTTLSLIKLYEDRKWDGIFAIGWIHGLSLFCLIIPRFGCIYPRELANRNQCKNALKHIGLALHNYHDTDSTFPASSSVQPIHSWRVDVLPFLDQEKLFDSYDRATAWDSILNSTIATHKVDSYICPSNAFPTDSNGRWYAAYSMPTGPRTIGESSTGTRFGEITDGASNTLLVVEACGSQIIWTEPRDVNVVTQPAGINLKGAKPRQSDGWMSSYHQDGVQVLMADGAVRFLNQKTDPTVLKQLATKDGGEELGDF